MEPPFYLLSDAKASQYKDGKWEYCIPKIYNVEEGLRIFDGNFGDSNGFNGIDYLDPLLVDYNDDYQDITESNVSSLKLEYRIEVCAVKIVETQSDLMTVIKLDCYQWMQTVNENKIVWQYLYLQECENSKDNGLYQLILNGYELWYRTLQEINAVVKSMLNRAIHPERYEV